MAFFWLLFTSTFFYFSIGYLLSCGPVGAGRYDCFVIASSFIDGFNKHVLFTQIKKEEEMLLSIVELIVLLNPFALFLYLEPLRKDLTHKQFLSVILKASLISLFICYLFFFSGEFLFKKVFLIDFESFRIFGGIIIFSYAYFYIVKGQKALIMIKENLNDLASEIALPFMVGAGTISLSILTSYRHTRLIGILVLLIAFVINFGAIFLLKISRDSLEGKKLKTAYDKNMEVFLRLNGFFIGAIGINMILTGIKNMFNIG